MFVYKGGCMREIKLRAWDNETGEIVYPHKIDFNIKWAYYVDSKDDSQRVRIDTLMQYTGLDDANGTPIYEGDIVECEHYRTCEPLKLVVEWEESELSFVFTEPHDYCLSCDEIFHIMVVGNIYENPELLKED